MSAPEQDVQSLWFPLQDNEDETLTCVLCFRPSCEKLIEVYAAGEHRSKGVHKRCAQDHTRWQREKIADSLRR